MKKEVELWWKQAIADLETAKANLGTKRYYACSFYSQQAAEKALKAVYVERFKRIIKVHNIIFLAQQLKLNKEIITLCDELNPVYIETRYPDASGHIPAEEYTFEDAHADLERAEKIILCLKEMI